MPTTEKRNIFIRLVANTQQTSLPLQRSGIFLTPDAIRRKNMNQIHFWHVFLNKNHDTALAAPQVKVAERMR